MNNENFETIEKNLGLKIDKQTQERLENFEQLFKVYNSHTNLVSKNDEKNLFEKHIYDSLCLSLFFKKYSLNEKTKLMDIGTGGGFPSIPLSIFYKETEIFPVDSIAKKIGFIELIEKELRLENLHPTCKRAEDLPKEMRATFDVVTCRAVAPLNTLLEYAIPFLKTGGHFVAFKSKTAKEEIDAAENALKVLNSEIVDRIPYELPHEEDFTREFIVIKKLKKTPSLYPRKSGLARKNPL